MGANLKDRLALNKSQAKQGKNGGANGAEDPVVKDGSLNGAQHDFQRKDTKMVGGLQKIFVELSEIPEFADLGIGSQPSFDDPIAFLNRRVDPLDPKSDYVIRKKHLSNMVAYMLKKGEGGKAGVTFGEWSEKAAGGGQARMIEQGFGNMVAKGGFDQAITKALDTGGTSTGAVLIRTDIEPLMKYSFLRAFPMYDRLRKIPANGLVHTYNVITDAGSAVMLGELQDLTSAGADSTSSFVRKTSSNIAIFATRRGISLKVQFASRQSGMNFNLEGTNNIEVMNGLVAMARLAQAQVFQGNQNLTYNTKTLNDEEGLYNVNGFTGLRQILKGGTSALTLGGAQTITDGIDQSVAQLINAGGDVEELLIALSVGARRAINAELQPILRIIAGQDAAYSKNLSANGLITVSDYLSKFMNIPADSQGTGIGYYNLPGPIATEDIFILDTNGIAIPYLGSPNPVVLELPLGYNGVLANVYIIFMMNGLMVEIENFQRKLRIPKTTV